MAYQVASKLNASNPMKGMRTANAGSKKGSSLMAMAPSQYGTKASKPLATPSSCGDSHSDRFEASSCITPNDAISSTFQGARPKKPGSTYARQNSSSANRGRRRTADWAMMAGDGLFKTEGAWRQGLKRIFSRKKSSLKPGCFSVTQGAV